MKNKISIFIFALFLMLSFGSVEQIYACSCLQTKSCQAYNNADTIFVGKVIGSKEQKTVEDYSENSDASLQTKPKTITYDVGEIYFEVQESFLGNEKGSRITIFSGTDGGDCGFWFKRGETYLVYAQKENSDSPSSVLGFTDGGSDKNLEPQADRLWTSICSHTALITQAKEDLAYLRDLSINKNKSIIFGDVSEVLNYREDEETKPFAKIPLKFQLTGEEGSIFETVTSKSGKYEIKLPSGSYRVIPIFPDYAQMRELGSDRTEFTVKNFGCVKADFVAENKSKISGKLISVEGKPIAESTVELINSQTKEWVESADTDVDGNFLLEGIPTGKYFISINREISPNADSPYPTFYYPNSLNVKDAKLFEIGLGQSFENITFQLPSKLEEQEIRGTVIWEDGKPAAKTRVEIEDTAENTFFRKERVTETDDFGNFTLKGFVGRFYKLKAEFVKYEDLTKEQAQREMDISGNTTIIEGVDRPTRYAKVTRGKAEIKPFKVGNKPLTFKIVLK